MTSPADNFDSPWQMQASCATDFTPAPGHDNTLDWFDPTPSSERRAATVCLTKCPVRRHCLHYVMGEYPEPHLQPEGIWAGLGRAERKRLRQRWHSTRGVNGR